jgi:hypothetical protein
MPLNVDALGTGSLVVNNQEVNVSGIGTTYQKLNKNWSYITVGATEIVIDSILVPVSFSCGNLTPYVNFTGNIDTDRYENLTFKIYLNERPVLDGNETLISSDNRVLPASDFGVIDGQKPDFGVIDGPIQIGTSTTFNFGASFLDKILFNISYSYKEQNKTTIDYLTQPNFSNIGVIDYSNNAYEINTIETYDCTKQYYAILTATASNVGVASLAVTLDRSGGGRMFAK